MADDCGWMWVVKGCCGALAVNGSHHLPAQKHWQKPDTHVSKPILSLDLIPWSGFRFSPITCFPPSLRAPSTPHHSTPLHSLPVPFPVPLSFPFGLAKFRVQFYHRWQLLSSFAFSAEFGNPLSVSPAFLFLLRPLHIC